MMKYCPACHKLYQHADQNFHKDSHYQDGYKTKCKRCIKDNRIKSPVKKSRLNPIIQKYIDKEDI